MMDEHQSNKKLLAEIRTALKREARYSTPKDSREVARAWLNEWFDVIENQPVVIDKHWSDEPAPNPRISS